MSQVRVVSDKTIKTHKLFSLKEVKIEDKNGKKHAHINVARNPTVAVFPLTDSYEVYLIYQDRYFLKRVNLEVVGGFIDKGESAISAAKRELKEEAGITAEQFEEFGRIEIGASVIVGTVHLFLAKELEIGDAEPEDDESIEVVKMSLNQAIEKIMTGQIKETSTIAGVFMLDRLRKEKKL